MPFFQHLLPYYLAAISLISVIVCIFDKRRAVKHGWRVPERRLLLLSALGGAAAMFVTMRVIRHKTRRAKFMLGLPLMIILQLTVLFFVYRY